MRDQEVVHSQGKDIERRASRVRLSIDKRTVKSRRRTVLGLFKISLCFLLLITSCVSFQANVVLALEEVRDQGQTGGGGNTPFIINEGNSVYQTFRAGYTGELNKVMVMIRNNSLENWAEEGLVRILSEADGAELGRQNFSIPSLSNNYSSYEDIYFQQRPELLKDNVYRIELSTSSGSFSWVYHDSDSYGRGQSSIHPGYDFIFSTYMLIDIAPPTISFSPQPTAPTSGNVEINVDVSDESGIESVKWAEGQRSISDFMSIGTDITSDRSFIVEQNGWYTVYAKDSSEFGNERVETIHITNIYKNNPQKPVVTTSAQIVNTATIVVTGTAEPETEVLITGGAAERSGEVNAAGQFSIEVPLRLNTLNLLELVARNPVGTDSETEALSIIHSNQKPIIQLLGDPSVQLIQGAEYVDAGATVDSFVYGETGEPTVTNLVQSAVPGSYAVSYVYTNGAGYEADVVTRLVTVEPATTITLQGPEELTIQEYASYEEPGYTAQSYYDGDLTAQVSVTGSVDTTTIGTYELKYNVSDSKGFAALEQTRLIQVVEADSPAAPILTTPAQTVNKETIVLSGTAELGTEVWITGGAVERSGKVNAAGEFSIEVPLQLNTQNLLQVVARNIAGKESEAVTVAIIHSNQKPIIQLLGDPSVQLIQGAEYVDAGVTVDSFVYGETGEPTVTNMVDSAVPGTYSVSYVYTNGAGYEADVVTRWVIVEPATTITLQGESEYTITAGEVYVEPGYVAQSYYDGDLTEQVNVTGSVDSSVVGVYELSYNVTDSRGFAAEEQHRFIRVVEAEGPIPPTIPTVPTVPNDSYEEVAVLKSTDATLKEFRLLVAGQELALSPKFNPNTFSYTARTSAAKLTLQLETGDQQAKIKIGDKLLSLPQTLPLQIGENEWIINVQSEQGALKTYRLVVLREADATAPVQWTDIVGHWSEAAILEAHAQGWLKGYTDDTFQPHASVSRAEFTRLLVQALKLGTEKEEEENQDIVKEAEHEQIVGLEDRLVSNGDRQNLSQEELQALTTAVTHGLLQGDGKGYLNPQRKLSRAEMTMILYRVLRGEEELSSVIEYKDAASIPQWATESIGKISAYGIVQGRSDGSFAPHELTTRAEAVTVILRLLKQREDQDLQN